MLKPSELKVLNAAIRLNTFIVAIAFGVLGAAVLWLGTVVLLLRGGNNVGMHLSLLALFLPGFSVTWSGAFAGAFWGFVYGTLSGTILYSAYAQALRRQFSRSEIVPSETISRHTPTLVISGNALGAGLGMLFAIQLIVTTNWLAMRGAPAFPEAELLGHYLPGYTVSFVGSLIGGAELFVVAFVAAHLVAGVYNLFRERRSARLAALEAPEAPAARGGAPRIVHPPAGHVAVLGAGPAGLATAHEFSTNGGRVTVLERNDYVGGLCRTVESGGYRFDLGGHRWFTKNEDLNNWFRRLMKDEIVMVNRISRIYYDGKYYMYPVAIGDVVKNAGPITIVKAGIAFVLATFRYAILKAPVRNMKDAYTAQFGSTLYQMFFRRYTEKVWGKPCEELSSDWVSQRSKGLSIWSVVREALSNRKTDVKSLIEEFMYPRDGYMRIPERMTEDIERAGSKVLLGTHVKGVVAHGPNDYEVVYAEAKGDRSIRVNQVVSTIPLGRLVQMMTPAPDAAVIEAARSLEFRDLITVNLKLNRERVSKDTWLYVQDESILFGRLHEPKNWSPAMVPAGNHTSLVLECFCTLGDSIWQMSDDDVARRCVDDLARKLRFIEPEEVAGWTVVRTRFAYPVYDLQYAGKLELIHAYLARFQGLHIVGRGGTFRYNNADHSIEMGLLLGQRLLGYNVDYLEVNTEPEYQEIKRADDTERARYVVGAAAPRQRITSPT